MKAEGGILAHKLDKRLRGRIFVVLKIHKSSFESSTKKLFASRISYVLLIRSLRFRVPMLYRRQRCHRRASSDSIRRLFLVLVHLRGTEVYTKTTPNRFIDAGDPLVIHLAPITSRVSIAQFNARFLDDTQKRVNEITNSNRETREMK